MASSGQFSKGSREVKRVLRAVPTTETFPATESARIYKSVGNRELKDHFDGPVT